MLKKFTPYLITAGVVLGTVVVYKIAKPYLPSFITNLIPF